MVLLFAQECDVVLSVQLAVFDLRIHKIVDLMVNESGSEIGPCGTPYSVLLFSLTYYRFNVFDNGEFHTRIIGP